jgi:hypothetical protein
LDASFVGLGCLFFRSTATASWDEANTFCQGLALPAQLVAVSSPAQLAFLQSQLESLEDHEGGNSWWTVGTDVGQDGAWVWAADYSAVGEWVWGGLQPSGNRGDNCLGLGPSIDYLAANYLCSTPLHPLCEQCLDCTPQTTTIPPGDPVTITITTRNALDNQVLPGVTVEGCLDNGDPEIVVTDQNGVATIVVR